MSSFHSPKPDTNMHIIFCFLFCFLINICTMEPEVDNNSNALTEEMVGLLMIRKTL